MQMRACQFGVPSYHQGLLLWHGWFLADPTKTKFNLTTGDIKVIANLGV